MNALGDGGRKGTEVISSPITSEGFGGQFWGTDRTTPYRGVLSSPCPPASSDTSRPCSEACQEGGRDKPRGAPVLSPWARYLIPIPGLRMDDLTLVLSAATGLQRLPAKMIALLLLAGGAEVTARQLATRMSPHRRLRHAHIEALAADVSLFVGEVRTARAYAMSADGFAESWRLMGAVSDAIRQEIARLDGLDQ